MAAITKRPSGLFQAQVSFNANGKRKRITKGSFKTKTDAKKWAASYELKKDAGIHEDSNQLLSEYFLNWYQTYKTDITDVSLDQYHQAYLMIKKYASHATLDKFERSDFQKLINAYAEEHVKTSVFKRKGEIQAALRDAYADGIISKDPTVRITVTGKKSKSADLKFLESDDFEKLEEYSYQRTKITSYLAILIAIHTGLRSGEIRALTVADINFNDSTLSVNHSRDLYGHIKVPKTKNSIRTIKIDKKLLDVLKNYRDQKGYLANVSDGALNKTLKYALNSFAGKIITFHGLRHSHASFLLSKGISIQYVSERLGHANVAITQKVYAHLLQTKRLEEEDKTSKLMNFNRT
ncbi:site-specific integrase [Oenococcus oeni]|uniref:site-specific integrase n=1 Tax=Oenococcus oeni TaxID=1247 RepID=UPI0010B824E8|nr:site-specific integrase [Oenococcus oeni]SYW16243.1 putative integrase [Oenococcus oeni]SYW19522.1 putative integrase [Oenococcus oeni]